MLVVNGVLVRRSGVTVLKCRRCGLAPETQYSENGEPNPVWALGICAASASATRPSVMRIPRDADRTRTPRILMRLNDGLREARSSRSQLDQANRDRPCTLPGTGRHRYRPRRIPFSHAA